MTSVERCKSWNRRALRCFVAKTQNPVRATSCRFDSDLRHLIFQGLRAISPSPYSLLSGCGKARIFLFSGPPVDHSVSHPM